MAMTLTVLGRCGSYPGPGEACSGYLLQADGTTVWIDAGSGTLANLQRHVGLREIDALVLSHEHPDHWTDLTGFYVACRYYLRRDHVPVFAPASLRELAYYRDEPIDWRVVADGESATVGSMTLAFSRTDHPPETLAVRVDGGGRSFAYSADTGPGWSFDRFGDGIDLALCEATFLREHEGKTHHLSARQAGEMARKAGVSRLVLTHLQPGTDPERSKAEGTEAFGADVDVAVENERYEV